VPRERRHRGKYTLPEFIRFLNSWHASSDHEPGKQYLYSNTAMVLLRVALERRFTIPFARLMRERLTGPLGMNSTALPLSRDLFPRTVQGYGPMGRPIGRPGSEKEGIFAFPASGQVYSSARDMATFLAANLGEVPEHPRIEDGMALSHQGVFTVNPHFTQALAWQIIRSGNLTILDKNGGLPTTSTYIGFVPDRKLGLVVLCNRGKQHATKVGRQILHALARDESEPSSEGAEPNPDID
jgi:beta-lactamase class C